MPLHILIVGAGIAGLSAAIALGREGHRVDIFEKSAFSSEIGAAFHFGPYGCRMLRHWGVDIESMRPCICKRWRHMESNDMSEIELRFVLDQKERDLGVDEDEIMVYRIDAHNVLREHALGMSNVKLHLGDGVTSINPEQGKITLTSGSVHSGDLVVGADGVHSKAVGAIDPDASHVESIGINMYRFMVDADRARLDPLANALLEKVGFPNTHNTIMNMTTKQMLVLYSCRNGQLVNCATFQNAAAEKVKLTDSYTNPGTVEEVLDLFGTWSDGWSDNVKALTCLAEDVKHFAIVARDVPKTYVKGKLAVLGDAAHPTMPTNAAGANMCLEDAGVLGALLDARVTNKNLAQRLDLYNKTRYARSATVKFASEMVALGQGKDAVDRLEKLLQEKVPGATFPPDMDAYTWPFDAIKNAKEMLAAVS